MLFLFATLQGEHTDVVFLVNNNHVNFAIQSVKKIQKCKNYENINHKKKLSQKKGITSLMILLRTENKD